MSGIKTWLKAVLPAPVSNLLRIIFHYIQRIVRWLIILVQVKGNGFPDTIKLYLSALASPALSIRNLTVWQDPVLLFDINVRVPGVGRFALRKNTDDLWHVLPWRKRAIFREIKERLEANSTFVDAGSNIGFYTVLASRLVGDDGVVIAVEMMPETVAILRHHLDLNGCQNVVVVDKALSDRSSNTVTATIRNCKSGQASIALRNHGEEVKQVNVQTVTLDKICLGLPAIDLIKMDLEGGEAMAFTGAVDTLRKTNAIIFETIHDVTDNAAVMLKASGFKLQSLTGKDLLALRA